MMWGGEWGGACCEAVTQQQAAPIRGDRRASMRVSRAAFRASFIQPGLTVPIMALHSWGFSKLLALDGLSSFEIQQPELGVKMKPILDVLTGAKSSLTNKLTDLI